MRFVRSIVCVSSLALGSVAYAQDPQTPPPEATPAPAPAKAADTAAPAGSGYMGPEINRALTLPQGGIEGELALIITRFSVATPVGTASSTGEAMVLGGRYGIMPALNAGAELSFNLNPDANFNTFLVNGEYEFMPGSMMMAAGRVDLGVTHTSAGMVSSNAFDLGLGVPFKYVLTPMFAFISGSQYSIAPFGFSPSSDILFFQFGDSTAVGLNIPVGLLAQIHPMFAAQFRTGFSLVHTSAADTKFVPINFDLISNLNAGGVGIDPYFSWSIAGNTDDYSALMSFFIGARVHL
jgi:hypothetical protein